MAKHTSFKGRDIISIRDFTRADIEHVLAVAKKLKQKPAPNLLSSTVLGACFFEPSTRTRLSFESAMQRLGGRVIGFADPSVTSSKKGETFHDTIKVVNQFTDVIVVRHYLEGAARYAAEVSSVPVINAGDGSNEHPSQALLDLFTMQEAQGKIDGLHIALAGDLKYGRGIHSLVLALQHFKVHLYFIAPPTVKISPAIRTELKRAGVLFSEHASIDEVIKKIDILYLTRMQEERFPDRAEYEKVKHAFFVTPELIAKGKASLRIMHIMPRVCEMDTKIDASPQAYYFEQVHNGLFVREALFALVLGKIS